MPPTLLLRELVQTSGKTSFFSGVGCSLHEQASQLLFNDCYTVFLFFSKQDVTLGTANLYTLKHRFMVYSDMFFFWTEVYEVTYLTLACLSYFHLCGCFDSEPSSLLHFLPPVHAGEAHISTNLYFAYLFWLPASLVTAPSHPHTSDPEQDEARIKNRWTNVFVARRFFILWLL